MGAEQLNAVSASAILAAITVVEETVATAAVDPSRLAAASLASSHFVGPEPSRLALPTAAGLGTAMALYAPPLLAQTAPIAEKLAVAAQSLPPTWAMVVGGLLYAEPAIRMATSAVRQALVPRSAESTTSLGQAIDKINEVTGRIAEHTLLARDASSAAMALHLAGHVLFSGEGASVTQALEAAAVAVSTFEMFHRGRVEGALERVTAEQGELSLEAYERLRYRSLGLTAPPIPDRISPTDRLEEQPPPYAAGVTTEISNISSVSTMWQTLKMVSRMSRLASQVIGWRTGVVEWWNTVAHKKHAPLHPSFVPTTNRIVRLWSHMLFRTNHMTTVYHNQERLREIPPGGRTVGVFFNHDSLWLNFASVFHILPHLRMMADAGNFWGFLPLRLIGFSRVMNLIGLPMVDRSKSEGIQPHVDHFKQISSDGLGYLVFAQGGRTPRTYNDDGSLAPPGLYTNLPFKKIRGDGTDDFAAYAKKGFASIAVDAANQLNKTIYIPVITSDDGSGTHGMYYTAPKIKKSVVIPTKNLSGQTTHISIAGVIPVPPGSDVHTINRQAIEAAKRELKINEYLTETVQNWARGRGDMSIIQDMFGLWSQDDERWFIVADRIRVIHPSIVEDGRPLREYFKQRLLDLFGQPMPPEEALKTLLADVSKAVKKYEYRSFS